MVEKEILEPLAGVDLAAFVVWEPILARDSAPAARRAAAGIRDPRAVHFWTEDRGLGKRFQPAIGLEGGPAWDVYLLYPPGEIWRDVPPVPRSFMHQLGGRLPAENRLDGARMVAAIRELVGGEGGGN